jgi:hypothetical protein
MPGKYGQESKGAPSAGLIEYTLGGIRKRESTSIHPHTHGIHEDKDDLKKGEEEISTLVIFNQMGCCFI